MAIVTSWGNRKNGGRVGIKYNDTLSTSADGSQARVSSFEFLFNADTALYDQSNTLTCSGAAVTDDSWNDPFDKSSPWKGTMTLATKSGQWQTLEYGSPKTGTCKIVLTGINYTGTLEETVTINYPERAYDLPAAPSSASFIGAGATFVSLSATFAIVESAPVDSVIFEYSTNNSTWITVPGVVGTVIGANKMASITHSGITPGTQYWYRVKGRNSSGDGTVYNYGPVWQTPSAPTIGTPNRTANNSITVNWTNTATGRQTTNQNQIYVSIDGGAYTLAGTAAGSATSWAYTAGTANHYYNFKVYAVNAGGTAQSAASSTILNSISAPINLSMSNLQVTTAHGDTYDTDKQSSQFLLNWQHAAATFVQIYDIYVNGSKVGETAAQSIIVTGIPAGQLRTITVRARRTSSPTGTSADSVGLDVTGLDVLDAPSSATFGSFSASGGKASVTLSWPVVNGAIKYHVATVVGSGETKTSPTATNSINISNMNPDTEYQFNIYTLNAVGYSVARLSPLATTPSVPGPVADMFVAYTGGQLTAEWGPPTDNGGASIIGYEYKIETQASAGAAWVTETDWTNNGMDTTLSINKETVYNYKVNVRAINGLGFGAVVFGETGIIGGFLKIKTAGGYSDIFPRIFTSQATTKQGLVRKFDGTNWLPITYD